MVSLLTTNQTRIHAILTREVTGSMTFYPRCRQTNMRNRNRSDQYTSEKEHCPYTPIQISIVKKQIKQIHLCHTQILQVKHIGASNLLMPIHIPFTSVFPFQSAKVLSCLVRMTKTRANRIRARAVREHIIG